MPSEGRAAMGMRRVRRRRRRSRGQAMVEFALIAPLFFTILFGIVEYSLITTSIGIMNFAAKDAARIGSLLGRQDPNADQRMMADIQQRSVGIVTAKISKIEVFKADTGGNPFVGTGCPSGSPCEDVYDSNFNLVGSKGWPEDQRNDTLVDADFLGVKISYSYTYLTGFVAGGLTSLQLTATSVQRIEPADYQELGRSAEGAIVEAPTRDAGALPQAADGWTGERRQGGAL